MSLQGQNVLMVGMARSGLAAIEFMHARGAQLRATDTRAYSELDELVRQTLERLAVPFEQQTPDLFQTGDLIVVSPGVPLRALPATRVPIVGEVEIASRYLQGPVIGITGSLGKTTTTSLVGHLLKECGVACQVGGNIGIPPTAMVTSSRADQYNVLELSSFQLATCDTLRPHIGAILNISENHLDWHGSMEHYVWSKGRLLQNQTADDHAVLHANDRHGFADSTAARVHRFSADVRDGVLHVLDEPFLQVAEIPLPGRHNAENAAAAATIAILAGADRQRAAAAVQTFQPVEHRLEFVRELDGVRYYNDSKATTPEAALRAIDALDGPLWIILGGKDKGLDFTKLGAALAGRAKGVLLVGQDAGKIAQALPPQVTAIHAHTVDNAVREAHAKARSGDIVLLAPACTSWDQFKSYEERGRFFKAAVRELS